MSNLVKSNGRGLEKVVVIRISILVAWESFTRNSLNHFLEFVVRQ